MNVTGLYELAVKLYEDCDTLDMANAIIDDNIRQRPMKKNEFEIIRLYLAKFFSHGKISVFRGVAR